MVIVVIVQGVKIYLDHQESIAKEDQMANTEEELAITMQRLTDISAELEEKIAEIQELGGNVEELEQAKAEIEAELSKNRRASRRTIQDLKDKVGGYELLLKAKDEEIAQLKEINTELLSENTTLKTEKNVLNDSLSQLNESKEELVSKVAKASELRAENIQIFAINNRGKERESPFKARQAAKLKEPDDYGNLQFYTDFRDIYANVLENWLCIDSQTVNEVIGRNHTTIEGLGITCVEGGNGYHFL